MLRTSNHSLFAAEPDLAQLMLTNPVSFTAKIRQQPNYLTHTFAQYLDTIDPLNYTSHLFNIDQVIPFAGHSLGPVFLPVLDKIMDTAVLQKKLHAGHFSSSHPEGKDNGHWFECDRHKPSLAAAKQLLGFKDNQEFIFTANGLSDNLARLLDTFFRPSKKDWLKGKNKILMLGTDFFSDQAVVASVMQRAITTAMQFEIFKKPPELDQQIIKLNPDQNGIYHTEQIITAIKLHAANIKVICLSDIVFGTGQRLELTKIFTAVKKELERHEIIVGLDLAHSIGNRAINLANFPVQIHFAVGCAYKHLCGFAGSSFGIYVNKNINLNTYPPLQGWKAAAPERVFATINRYDPTIMAHAGAVAFRLSNPPPVPLAPVQVYLNYFGQIGFEKCFNKSECLTRYLIDQLQSHLGAQIEFITPLDANQRGAMIVIRVPGLQNVQRLEERLNNNDLNGSYEIDTRPPNNIRLTAHYAYTKFAHIAAMVEKLQAVIVSELRGQLGNTIHQRK
jgi:kynureninase